MGDAKERPHPSVPANYVSFLDLRERWMKQQQLKNQNEEIQKKKEVQGNSELLDAQQLVKPEGEDKDDDDGHQKEELQPDQSSLVPSNPNPNYAIRTHSYGNRPRRWVPLKQSPVVTTIRPKNAPPITTSKPEQSKPPPLEVLKIESDVQVPAEIEVANRKLNSVAMSKAKMRCPKRNPRENLLQSQPNAGVSATKGDLEEKSKAKVLQKPPPSELETAIKVAGEIKDSDEAVRDSKLNNGKTKKPNEGVLAPNANLDMNDHPRVQEEPKEPPSEAIKVNLTVQPQTHNSDDPKPQVKNTKSIKNWKRNQKGKNVIQPQLKKETLPPNDVVEEKKNPQQEVEADNSRVETEVKLASLSVTSAAEKSNSHGSIAARNGQGWMKNGRNEIFERKIMEKERAIRVGSLIWVKKGESSQTSGVTVKNSGNNRV